MLNRRDFLKSSAAFGATAVVGSGLVRGETGGDRTAVVHAARETYEQLRKILAVAVGKNRRTLSGGVTVFNPSNGTYNGIWPDDCFYPYIADPGLANKMELQAVVGFLTESMVGMSCMPDRIEYDGLPILKPGGDQSAGFGSKMPAHLPAAWVRALDYMQQYGVTIPRKDEWAQLFRRSLEQVSFSCGLVYIDPQSPSVGFGFHDPCAITGFELMSSLMLQRGLERAVRLFKGSVEAATLRHWASLADHIKNNLYRLYDAQAGAYLAGSKNCRQVNVWANGLAYWLSDEEKKTKIVSFYRTHKNEIFKSGYTRQITEPGGWQRHISPVTAGTYTNGGFWAVGTGFVLAAIANQDPALARELFVELAANIEKLDICEWINAQGQINGAHGFLASLTVPMIGLRSIIEDKPMIGYF